MNENDAPPMQWYHIMIGTYGSWLYGDPRGFRTRHHREHVEGDYKNPPPPGMYRDKEMRSRKSLKQAPVTLDMDLRPLLGHAMREKLEMLGAMVLCLAIAQKHIHVQSKLPLGKARHYAGIAKRHGWFALREQGWHEKLWAKRSKAIPIEDRQHQVNVYHYILGHAKQGAWVWSLLHQQVPDKAHGLPPGGLGTIALQPRKQEKILILPQ